MARNLKYQFMTAINDNFKEGQDKHSIKSAGEMNGTRIFSYGDREGLKDVSANFSNWMKEHHSDIKLVKEITSDHIQNFLNEKAETCTQATVEQYATKFNKLEKVVNTTFGIKADYQGFVVPAVIRNEKVRDSALSREDFKKLEAGFSESKSAAKEAIQLSSRLGLRVSETVKVQGRDINLDKGTVHIHDGKGGRDRDVPIRAEDKAYFADLKERTGHNERICPVKYESVNTAVRRCMKRVGISEKYKDTSIHAIRKMYAQESYDRFKEQDMESREALGKVSELLGHGEDRMGLIKEYVLKI
jgi:integrase